MAGFKYMTHAEYQQLLQAMELMKDQEHFQEEDRRLRKALLSGSQSMASVSQKPSQKGSNGEKKPSNFSSPSETKQEEWSVCKPVTSVLIGQVKPSTLTTEAVKRRSKSTKPQVNNPIDWF